MFDVLGNWSPLRSAIVSTSSMLLSFVLLFVAGSVAIAVIFVVLYGLAGGLLSIVRAILPLTMLPPRAYTDAAAKLALPLNLSFAAAPPVIARMLESQGAGAALVVTILLSALSMIFLVALARIVLGRNGCHRPITWISEY